MRILLLTAHTGGGHNSAAQAVQQELENQGVTCELCDSISFVAEWLSDTFDVGHSYLYRYLPRLFGVGYRFEERHPPRFLYNLMSFGAKKLAALVNEKQYDAIISSHIFGNMIVTEARKRYDLTIPHYLITTDYTCYPGTDMVDVKRYFISAEALRSAYEEVGIAPERIVVSGIPIRSSFLARYNKDEVRSSLGLPAHGRIVLMFSGSIGCGHLDRVAPSLEEKLPDDAHLVIVCGHNKTAYELLIARCGKKTTVVGFTDRIAEYMAAADLCVTKPGGLSTTELLAIQLPMVLVLSVPGVESRNMEYFEEQQIAVGTRNWEEAIDQTVCLLQSPAQLQAMRERMTQITYPGGAKIVVQTVLADLNSVE